MLRNFGSKHFRLVSKLTCSQGQASPYSDRNSVGESWNNYFVSYKPSTVEPKLSSESPGGQDVLENQDNKEEYQQLSQPEVVKKIELMYKCYSMFRMYCNHGHLLADLDPLALPTNREFGKRTTNKLDISLQAFKFAEADLDVSIFFGDAETRRFIHPFMEEKEDWTVREMYAKLQQLYCGRFALEYMHIVSIEEKCYLEQSINDLAKLQASGPTKIEQSKTLKRLARAHAFNEFLKTKFPTSKRFGIEGCDTLISGLGALVDQCAKDKIDNVVFGMAHRGRLSTLANVFHKPVEIIFAEFQNKFLNDETEHYNQGDVKYHLGTALKKTLDGHSINMFMLPNPSHLEAVNPVVSGKTRSIQELCQPQAPTESALAIIIHGDASIAGQGVVYEHLQMQNLDGYSVKGSVHIVVNNQIGFTTVPVEGRSGLHCTEVAKAIESPIIHVNADDPDLVDAVMRIAVQFRNKFQKDIMVDLIGYRRYGHNEQDQPAFTQPLMYKRIEEIKPVYLNYVDKLISTGTFTQEEIDTSYTSLNTQLEKAYQRSRKEGFSFQNWTTAADDKLMETDSTTGIAVTHLQEIGSKLTQIPASLVVHPTIKRIYDQRRTSVVEGKGIDFATAESLAFGSLIEQGFSVRLSGQDVERATFSQRHCVLNDQNADVKWYPLRELVSTEHKQRFQVYNSLLSEYAVLGFEYGYSLSNPNTLTLWEAQFGDFANGAQIMIDNFVTSGEVKWSVPSGLVMMLPHGMDGQGPEHSSARLERFLQLSNDDVDAYMTGQQQTIQDLNMQVCVCSTAANYFHVLRRQLRRDFRKPLILFNSKRLLKAPKVEYIMNYIINKAFSDLQLFNEHTGFQQVIDDQTVAKDLVKEVVVCYGQIYYDILDRKNKLNRNDVAIVRLEQLAPFPYQEFTNVINGYKNAKVVFCQEEHQNSGGWSYLEHRINAVLQKLNHTTDVSFHGRRASSSTASGSSKVHSIELEKILEKLFR